MAHHKPTSKTHWLITQKRSLSTQKNTWKHLKPAAQKVYQDNLKTIDQTLKDDANILEIGSGIACISQYFTHGNKTYLDPLMDDFKRLFPGELPEGRLLNTSSEYIALPDQSFDLILCVNALDCLLNPELCLHEIRRLLTKDGTLIIRLNTYPSWLARWHYLILNIFPKGPREQLYRYSYQGLINTLSRHFNITEQYKSTGSLMQETWLFHCKHK